MDVLERMVHFDFWLFSKINGTWTNSVFDTVLPFLRESVLWIPLYLFLLVFILTNFGLRGVFWSIALICTAAFCDLVSSHVLRESIIRVRPCRDPDIAGVRFLAIYCPTDSGFVSSHAANHFGIALFVYVTLRRYIRRWVGLFFVWAATVSYAQVYVGVHFPFDVIAGCLVGCLLGVVTGRLFNSYSGLVW